MAQTQATEPDPAAAAEAAHYWGYLLKPDKTPNDLLDALLRGIANYISTDIEPKGDTQLTPAKLAAFYRLVGGNYDSLFLDTPYWPLSHIYQYLGCAHSLLPTPGDDFAPPSIPALEQRGFVRWQTIQILLGPEEHVPYLQEALLKFDIINPIVNGDAFPKILPREAFPLHADEEMLRWHEGATQRLKSEAFSGQAQHQQDVRTPDANNGPARPGSRVSESESLRSEAEDYFSSPHSHHEPSRRPRSFRTGSSSRSHSHSSRRQATGEERAGSAEQPQPGLYTFPSRSARPAHRTSISDRRASTTGMHEPLYHGVENFDFDGTSPSAAAAAAAAATAGLHSSRRPSSRYSRHRSSSRSHSRHSTSRTRRARGRTSISSVSSDASSLDDSDDDRQRVPMSIPIRPRPSARSPPPPPRPLRHHRSHELELDRDALRGNGPFVTSTTVHPRRFSEQPQPPFRYSYADYAPQAPTPPPPLHPPAPAVFVRAPTMQASQQGYYMPRRGSGSPGSSSISSSSRAHPISFAPGPGSGPGTGSNIRWRNADGLFDLPPPSPVGPGVSPLAGSGFRRVPSRSVDGDRPRVRRFVSPIVGVDGRRYPAYESLR